MPIYEYRCNDCKKKVSLLFLSFSSIKEPTCSYCGSKNLTRLISRFAVHRSEESRLERIADPSRWGNIDENDPKSILEWTKRMGQEMGVGDELGKDFDEMVESEFEKETKKTSDESENSFSESKDVGSSESGEL